MPCVDLIIPMYNSERYIPELVQCLQKQTLQDFRAIFVDDGSKDDTYQVLCQYLQDVDFDHLIVRQENKGLPGARNAGIRNANSEWIAFMDSDDGLDPHYLEFLYQGVKQSCTNVAICDYQIISEAAQARKMNSEAAPVRVITSEECIRNYYTKWFGTWTLMLRRQWLEEQQLEFDEVCTYLEDVPFITQVIANAERITMVEEPLYLYYMREGSLMHTPKIEKYQIALDGFERMARRMADVHNAAAEEFRSMGHARYYLATLRKGAVLMPYAQFKDLCSRIPMKSVKHQLKNLPGKLRMAGELYLLSKPLFYHAMRAISKE